MLARRIPGFGEVTAEVILHVAAGVAEEEEEDVTTEEIMEEVAENERGEEEMGREEVEEEEEEETKGGWSLSTLSTLLSQLEKLKEDVQELEDDDSRRKAAVELVASLLKMYGDVHTSKLHQQKQRLITRHAVAGICDSSPQTLVCAASLVNNGKPHRRHTPTQRCGESLVCSRPNLPPPPPPTSSYTCLQPSSVEY